MASHLSDEDFERLQAQVIELRTANYSLEEQCRKYKTENQSLAKRALTLESECQKLQKTIHKSKKVKDIDLLLSENENLQVKLEAQEDEFRLQNQTLLQEFSSIVKANEELERVVAELTEKLDGIFKTDTIETCCKVHSTTVATVVSTEIAEDFDKTEKELKSIKEIMQLLGMSSQEESLLNNEGEFVEVGEVVYQKHSVLHTRLLKEAVQKMHNLEHLHQRLKGVNTSLEKAAADKMHLESELKQVQEKLRRKQESLLQLQEEKEKLYTESRKAYEELQQQRDEDLNDLNDQNNRLNVKLNNTQHALQDYKEKSAKKILALEAQLNELSKKTEKTSDEHVLHLQAKVIELEVLLDEAKKELQSTQQEKSYIEENFRDTVQLLQEKQALLVTYENEKIQLTNALEEAKLLAQKRKSLVDEMSIRIQQKSDDYKHQLSNLTNEFSNKEEELKKQINTLQADIKKLTPLQGKLDHALVKITNLEATREWYDRRLKEAEESSANLLSYYEDVTERLKKEQKQEVDQLKSYYENVEKALKAKLELAESENVKKDEAFQKLQVELHDAGEEKQLAEKKVAAVMKDLRRQLAAERKRVEKLQERIRELVASDGSHNKSDLNKSQDPETSSISSWSMMSGHCEPRDSSTRETSLIAGSLGTVNGNVSPSPEEQDLEQENLKLVNTIAAMQQEKWVLEERINHLEQGSAAMAEDLMRKTALIEFYCMEGRTDPTASSSVSSPSTEKLSMKKFVELLKGDEHVHESNKRMQRMIEETLTKNMHLQTNLEHLSKEVIRLRKETENNQST